MTLYCGIDLHGNNSLISLIDDNDRIVSEWVNGDRLLN